MNIYQTYLFYVGTNTIYLLVFHSLLQRNSSNLLEINDTVVLIEIQSIIHTVSC